MFSHVFIAIFLLKSSSRSSPVHFGLFVFWGGVSWRAPGTILELFLGAFGGALGSSWGALGAPWRPLGSLLVLFGAL